MVSVAPGTVKRTVTRDLDRQQRAIASKEAPPCRDERTHLDGLADADVPLHRNLVERGGNFGWSEREGQHPFGATGVGVNKEMIEPIWEYHHDVGKSITGGTVYRGNSVPELKGMYLYADYVTGKQWALQYDDKEKRVTANRQLQDLSKPILSFGEDEKGEVYYLTTTLDGQGIYKFLSTGK